MRPTKHAIALQNGDLDDQGDLDNAAAEQNVAEYGVSAGVDIISAAAGPGDVVFDRASWGWSHAIDPEGYNYADRYDERTGVWYRRAKDSDDWYALS